MASYDFIGIEFTDPAASSTDFVATTPGSAQDGDLLIVGIVSPVSSTWSLSGWTNEGEIGGASYARFTFMTMIVSGTPASTYTFSSSTSDNHFGYMAAYRGPTSYSVLPEGNVGTASENLSIATDSHTNSVGAEPLLLHYCWWGTAGLGGGTYDHDHVLTTPSITLRSSAATQLPAAQREQDSGSMRVLFVGDEEWNAVTSFPSRTGEWAAHTAAHGDIANNVGGGGYCLTPSASQGLSVSGASDAWGWIG